MRNLIAVLLAVLQEATPAGWTVVDMKNDWNTVFAK